MSPELIAILAVGVALAALILDGWRELREEIRALRKEMRAARLPPFRGAGAIRGP